MYKKLLLVAVLLLGSSLIVAQDEYTGEEDMGYTEEGTTDETQVEEVQSQGGYSLIPSEAVFKGTFYGRKVKIDGVLEGKAILDDDIQVSEIGEIKGNVETVTGIVKGRVDGSIWASEELVLKPTAVVTGEAMCRNLVVEKGAMMSTKTSMGEIKTVEGKKTVVTKKTKAVKRARTRTRRSY